jgi:hypothetical protein
VLVLLPLVEDEEGRLEYDEEEDAVTVGFSNFEIPEDYANDADHRPIWGGYKNLALVIPAHSALGQAMNMRGLVLDSCAAQEASDAAPK